MEAAVKSTPSRAEIWSEIQAASERLAGVAHRTSLQRSRTLDARTGARVVLKCENLQRVGAFKFRGAYNAMAQLSPEAREGGVVTHSSGNHAQAVALAGKLLEIATTIAMPNNAPHTKRAATEGYGATVVEYDPETTDRAQLAGDIAARLGATLIPPFDHPHVIAGQGTAAVELLAAAGPLDVLLVPCGGGGLLSGTAVAARHLAPSCRTVGVEPELADDATRSFRTGELQHVHNPPTIADGTRVNCLGELTFPLIRENVADMCTVSEEAIRDAVRFLSLRMKLVVEPSGALPVAALLSGAVDVQGKRVGAILSGGNIDAAMLAEILRTPED